MRRLRLWLPWPLRRGRGFTLIEISNEFMSLSVNGEVIAIARFSMDAAADANGVDRFHPSLRLFNRDRAITALTVAELDR